MRISNMVHKITTKKRFSERKWCFFMFFEKLNGCAFAQFNFYC